MKKRLLIGGAVLGFAATAAFAADTDYYTTGELYRENEWSVDMFGSASLGRFTIENLSGARIREKTRLGGGVGINYFLARNIGFGVDAYSENSSGAVVDSASASVIARFPFGSGGFAPYVFGGGGRQFDSAKAWFVQAGAGMEYRFNPKVGVFLDARWVLPDETKYYGVARLGLRFAF